MKLLHRTEELHPCAIAEIEHNRKALTLDTREIALNAARWYFVDRHTEGTPEQILSVAAKFEAYLTAPETVLSEREETR